MVERPGRGKGKKNLLGSHQRCWLWGRHLVRETLLARMVARLGRSELVPLHRIDRLTAGLVMFSTNPESRSSYQDLFRKRLICKRYEALAPPFWPLPFSLLSLSVWLPSSFLPSC